MDKKHLGNPREARAAIRAGRWRGDTIGVAPGYVQGNLVILPRDWADEFLRFCHYNPKPCPIVGMTEPGDPIARTLGHDVDLRSDLGRYRIWRDGEMVEEVASLEGLWTDDLVGFVIGCSLSFEQALMDNGIVLRHHVEPGQGVGVYRTNIDCTPAGRFKGKLVVSMRPLQPADAIRAVQICSRFPSVHGAPVHFGDPAAIGIADVYRSDFGYDGGLIELRAGEVPVFWACGVTPQSAVLDSRPPLCITHVPGYMLVTDVPNHSLASF